MVLCRKRKTPVKAVTDPTSRASAQFVHQQINPIFSNSLASDTAWPENSYYNKLQSETSDPNKETSYDKLDDDSNTYSGRNATITRQRVAFANESYDTDALDSTWLHGLMTKAASADVVRYAGATSNGQFFVYQDAETSDYVLVIMFNATIHRYRYLTVDCER